MANLKELRGLFEPTARYVRVQFGGETIADSKQVMLLRDSSYDLVYYFPEADVRMDLLVPSEHTPHSDYKGDAVYWSVKVGDRVAENAAWAYPNLNENRPDLRSYIAFQWRAMDHWFEEDEEVFVHPRDPYHRVDTIKGSRHVRIEIDGQTIADTKRPYLLFETGLPTRYYIPAEDIRMELLEPTNSHTACPYKGVASYWSVNSEDQSHLDIVWGYLDPIAESPKI